MCDILYIHTYIQVLEEYTLKCITHGYFWIVIMVTFLLFFNKYLFHNIL